jgi:flagellar protein FlbD
MIHLTRINRAPLVLNSDLIEYIEKTPDTVVSLTNGVKLLVRESPDEIVEKVIEYRHNLLKGLPKEVNNSTGALIFPFPGPKPIHEKQASQIESEEGE